MVEPADFVCVSLQDKTALLQLEAQGQRPAQSHGGEFPFEQTRARYVGGARVFAWIASLTRAVALLFWLFPLLLIPKIVFWVLDNRLGDWITVAFVALAVLLFALLSLLVLMHAFVGPRSRRRRALALDEAPPSVDDAAAWLKRAVPPPTTAAELRQRLANPQDAPLRLRGRLGRARGTLEGAVLFRDSFRATLPLARLTRARGFVLWPEGEQGDEDAMLPPLLVELPEPPIVLARYGAAPDHHDPALGERFVSDYDGWIPALERHGRPLDQLFAGPTCVLCDGQEVELIAFGVEPLEDLAEARLAGRPLETDRDRSSAGPYRAAARQRSLRLVCTARTPLILRPLA